MSAPRRRLYRPVGEPKCLDHQPCEMVYAVRVERTFFFSSEKDDARWAMERALRLWEKIRFRPMIEAEKHEDEGDPIREHLLEALEELVAAHHEYLCRKCGNGYQMVVGGAHPLWRQVYCPRKKPSRKVVKVAEVLA